ncbi:MAG: guanylate kinase [marine benthic group bacterium]|nr:guanylate kinase [Gemmatimonadota bacterium]
MNDPLLLVLAGPSGGGKTTVCRRIVKKRRDAGFSVSATTRPPRPGELDGADYHFVTREEFQRLLETDGVLEWAEVHGELYGTPREALGERTDPTHCLLLDIDVQGARQVRERAPGAVLVFLVPPSAEEMLARLRRRGSEDEPGLARRMRTALSELEAAAEFDYVVVNEVLDATVRTVESILEAELHRASRVRDDVLERTAGLRKALEADLAGSHT